MEDEASFQEFAAARTPALLRAAHLLCGNHHEAEDLVQDAVDAGFADEDLQVEPGLDNAIEWAVAKAEENNDLAGGVLIIGSITLVAEARTLLGK